MDFSSLTTLAKKALAGSAPTPENTAAHLDQHAAIAGMNPAMLQEMTRQLKRMLADGKITEDEVRAQLAHVASKIGIPKMLVPKLTQAVFEHLKK